MMLYYVQAGDYRFDGSTICHMDTILVQGREGRRFSRGILIRIRDSEGALSQELQEHIRRFGAPSLSYSCVRLSRELLDRANGITMAGSDPRAQVLPYYFLRALMLPTMKSLHPPSRWVFV